MIIFKINMNFMALIFFFAIIGRLTVIIIFL